jgi:hypothetical protein
VSLSSWAKVIIFFGSEIFLAEGDESGVRTVPAASGKGRTVKPCHLVIFTARTRNAPVRLQMQTRWEVGKRGNGSAGMCRSISDIYIF